MRKYVACWIVLNAITLCGCESSNLIWVSGTLQKGEAKYTPIEGRKVSVYFYPIVEAGGSNPAVGEIEMADYHMTDGSFTVPGRNGAGILPGKYRIVISETIQRVALDEAKSAEKPKKRGESGINREIDFFDATFGPTTSPIIRDLKSSTKLVINMDKPTE